VNPVMIAYVSLGGAIVCEVAIGGGLGIVLTAVIGIVLFRQSLDVPAIIGVAMIVGRVVVMNVFSITLAH
jgi:small multidrug resistance pump